MESKIKSAKDWVNEYLEDGKGYPDLLYTFKEAQKQAIEAALKVASENAKMTGIAYGNDKSISDYEVDKNSILICKDLKELKII